MGEAVAPPSDGNGDSILLRDRRSRPVLVEVREGELSFEQQERARCKAGVAVGGTARGRLSTRVEVAEVGDGRLEEEVVLSQATGVGRSCMAGDPVLVPNESGHGVHKAGCYWFAGGRFP